MSEILGNIDGADAIMDDVIMYGQSKEEHGEGIDRVLGLNSTEPNPSSESRSLSILDT